ncbi:MAG: tetratricopeptide repeat protein [Lachnospiraceae bacterium]|nr:tetratricopeptide repeat protein [Lachnospiraceae bacterium]
MNNGMDVNVFYQTLDDLFANNELAQVEPYLTASLSQAKEDEDWQAYIAICNEMIGFYRSISQHEKAYQASEDVLLLMEELQLEDTEHFATVLLNSATAYRAGGRYRDAYEQYMRAAGIYAGLIPPEDYRFAGLYNNMSMLLEAMNENEQAAGLAEQALAIIKKQPDARMEEATTLTNLALIDFKLSKTAEAERLLREAVAIFEEAGEQTDAHYSGALAGLAEAAFRREDYACALTYYDRACEEVRKHFGENASYAILSENCAAVCERTGDEARRQEYLSRAKRVREALGAQ